jgi:hypothetical protein
MISVFFSAGYARYEKDSNDTKKIPVAITGKLRMDDKESWFIIKIPKDVKLSEFLPDEDFLMFNSTSCLQWLISKSAILFNNRDNFSRHVGLICISGAQSWTCFEFGNGRLPAYIKMYS